MGNPATFDTLEFTEQLKAAGVSDEQAKGHTKALVFAMKQAETRFEDLATKRDLGIIKLELTIRLGLMMAAMFGMFFTALRYFPPPVTTAHYQPPAQEMRVPAPVSVPPSMVAFLDQATAKLDTLTTEAHRAIDLLTERRSARISAAVTGQIDVRGFVTWEET